MCTIRPGSSALTSAVMSRIFRIYLEKLSMSLLALVAVKAVGNEAGEVIVECLQAGNLSI